MLFLILATPQRMFPGVPIILATFLNRGNIPFVVSLMFNNQEKKGFKTFKNLDVLKVLKTFRNNVFIT